MIKQCVLSFFPTLKPHLCSVRNKKSGVHPQYLQVVAVLPQLSMILSSQVPQVILEVDQAPITSFKARHVAAKTQLLQLSLRSIDQTLLI